MGSKPEKVNYMGIAMLASGVLNVLSGCGWTLLIVLGTAGIGIICAPFILIPAVLGGYEIYYALKIVREPMQPIQAQRMQLIAIGEIASLIWGNVPSAVAGVLLLVWLGDPEVKAFLEAQEPAASV